MRGIPGLLQTRSYASAVIRACRPYDAQEELERDAAARIERQNILAWDDPPKLWVVLSEGVLRQAVGGARVMREQLDHLLSLAEAQGIVLQVLPFAVTDAPGVDGPAAMFEFDDSPAVAYLEGWGAGRVVKDTKEVAAIGPHPIWPGTRAALYRAPGAPWRSAKVHHGPHPTRPAMTAGVRDVPVRVALPGGAARRLGESACERYFCLCRPLVKVGVTAEFY